MVAVIVIIEKNAQNDVGYVGLEKFFQKMLRFRAAFSSNKVFSNQIGDLYERILGADPSSLFK